MTNGCLLKVFVVAKDCFGADLLCHVCTILLETFVQLYTSSHIDPSASSCIEFFIQLISELVIHVQVKSKLHGRSSRMNVRPFIHQLRGHVLIVDNDHSLT
jgi:hypothetical protein